MAQDDFYYYLKPAQSLAWHHQATAFQHVWTNGYHPLYFVLLTVVSLFVKTLPGIYRLLWSLDTLSAAAIFLLTRQVLARLASPVLVNTFAVVMASLCIKLICFQMEVTLALPLAFAFLLAGFVHPAELTKRRAAGLGALGALTFLSRLDAGLLIALYASAVAFNREYRKTLRREIVGSFLACCLPLPMFYLWTNHRIFGTLLPISSMAKELRHGAAPSVLLFRTFRETDEFLLSLSIAAAILAFALRKHLFAREKVLLFATIAHPFLFYGLEMFLSDWPVWPWYFYSLRLSALGMAVIVCIGLRRSDFARRFVRYRRAGSAFAAVLLAGSLGKLLASRYYIDPWMVETQHAAGILRRFSDTHPGVYAMGDRAGMFLFTTTSPVLQTEGLLMDKAYVQHIRAQDDLRSTLSLYGVNYYVVFIPKISYGLQFSDGCFHAMEPLLAGPLSMRMRSDFCEDPIFGFPGFDGVYHIYPINPN